MARHTMASTVLPNNTYLLPNALLPRPADWGPEIDFAGCVLYQPALFTPPQTLIDFLNAGEPPVYIGFGSAVSPNPHGSPLQGHRESRSQSCCVPRLVKT